MAPLDPRIATVCRRQQRVQHPSLLMSTLIHTRPHLGQKTPVYDMYRDKRQVPQPTHQHQTTLLLSSMTFLIRQARIIVEEVVAKVKLAIGHLADMPMDTSTRAGARMAPPRDEAAKSLTHSTREDRDLGTTKR